MSTHPAPSGPGGSTRPMHGLTDRLPRYDERIADVRRLLVQALYCLENPVEPGTWPTGAAGHRADAGFEAIGAHLEAAQVELDAIADLADAGAPLPKSPDVAPGHLHFGGGACPACIST